MRTSALLFMLASASILWNLGCTHSTVLDEIQAATQEIQDQYAPDRRVAVWSVWPEGTSAGIPVVRGETNLPEAKDALFEKLRSQHVDFIDSLQVLPDETVRETPFGLVRLSVANIRSERGHSEEMATQALMGTPLRVLKKKTDWYLVQTPDGYLGWMDKDGLTLLTEEAFQKWQSADRVIFTFDFGFVLAQPFPGEYVSDLVDGNILEVVEKEVPYLKVRLPDGREGYIPDGSTAKKLEDWAADNHPSPKLLLSFAKRYLGRPYLWGGASGKGMDCSGFVKTVYYTFGLITPRDASQQVEMGELVETDTTWKNLLPGDLLFFGTPASEDKKERITHVAFYLGEGEILHAAGLVKMESLIPGAPHFAQERYDTFLKAKRINPEADTQPVNKHPLYFQPPQGEHLPTDEPPAG